MRILICAHEAPLEPFDGFRGAVASLVARLRDSNDVCLLAPRMPAISVWIGPRGVGVHWRWFEG